MAAVLEGMPHPSLATSRYLTLSTVDRLGRPWPTPVWFARDGDDLLWVAVPSARHSRDIARRPAVSGILAGVGALVFGEAAEVVDDDLDAAVAAFSRASVDAGLRAWRVADVLPPARHRLYRLRVTAVWERDHDGPVALAA